jgi:RHS repeat-associated protein
LTVVTVGGTVVATYTYDALNRRIGIQDNDTQTWTVYDGMSADTHPYADFNGSGNLTVRYLSAPGVFTGTLTSVILGRTTSSGTTAWYLTDRLGSVRDVVSTSGSELDHVVYDSFGNIVTETNASNGDRFKFAGMESDSATGQYYDRARDYNSGIGRFTALDRSGFSAGDPNLYRYVFNGPSTFTDPSGRIIPVVVLAALAIPAEYEAVILAASAIVVTTGAFGAAAVINHQPAPVFFDLAAFERDAQLKSEWIYKNIIEPTMVASASWLDLSAKELARSKVLAERADKIRNNPPDPRDPIKWAKWMALIQKMLDLASQHSQQAWDYYKKYMNTPIGPCS